MWRSRVRVSLTLLIVLIKFSGIEQKSARRSHTPKVVVEHFPLPLLKQMVRLAELVMHQLVELAYTGSSPVPHPTGSEMIGTDVGE